MKKSDVHTQRRRKRYTDEEADEVLVKYNKRYYNLQNTNPPIKLQNGDVGWDYIKKRPTEIIAFTAIIDEDGVGIGVAIEGERGYRRTMICPMNNPETHKPYEFSYDDFSKEADWLNKNLLGWTKERAEEIITSSFRQQNIEEREDKHKETRSEKGYNRLMEVFDRMRTYINSNEKEYDFTEQNLINMVSDSNEFLIDFYGEEFQDQIDKELEEA